MTVCNNKTTMTLNKTGDLLKIKIDLQVCVGLFKTIFEYFNLKNGYLKAYINFFVHVTVAYKYKTYILDD